MCAAYIRRCCFLTSCQGAEERHRYFFCHATKWRGVDTWSKLKRLRPPDAPRSTQLLEVEPDGGGVAQNAIRKASICGSARPDCGCHFRSRSGGPDRCAPSSRIWRLAREKCRSKTKAAFCAGPLSSFSSPCWVFSFSHLSRRVFRLQRMKHHLWQRCRSMRPSYRR